MTAHFALRSAFFGVTGLFHTSAPNNPKMTLDAINVKGTPYVCYCCPGVPNFTPLRSTTSRFEGTGHFETSAPNDLEPYKIKGIPYMCYQYPRVPNFRPLRSTMSRVTCHFKTIA